MTLNTLFRYYSAVVSFNCWRLLGKVQLFAVVLISLVVLTFSNI